MVSKSYTMISSSEEGLLKKIDNFIYHMHQSNQTADECKITVTVEKYED